MTLGDTFHEGKAKLCGEVEGFGGEGIIPC